MIAPEIGTFVRIPTGDGGQVLGVIVPAECARNYSDVAKMRSPTAFARVLEPDGVQTQKLGRGVEINGGWWLTFPEMYVVEDDEVPDDIQALAMRCLLDPNFVPFR